MTREQAFWLMVVAVLVAVFAKSFRAPSENFWDAPEKISVSEQEVFDFIARSLGGEEKSVERANEEPNFGETILDGEELLPKAKKKELEQNEPRPKAKKPKAKPTPAPIPASVPEEEPTVDLDEEAVEAMVSRSVPNLFQCYRYNMARVGMRVDGEVLVAITIDARGTVTDARFRRDSLQIPGLEECVAREFVGKRISPPPSESVVIKYPLLFAMPSAL